MKKRSRKDTRSKITPVQLLKAAIATRHRSQVEISGLRGTLGDKSARQVLLETTGDINNAAVISEIGKLQVFAEMLPRRIAFKEKEYVNVEENLVQATNDFIREHLDPRVRNLAMRTRMMVEKELSHQFRDPAILIRAVAQSDRVRSIARLDWPVSLQPERGAMAHAEGALKAWAAVDEFETTLPLKAA